jgi:hypothetical protein
MPWLRRATIAVMVIAVAVFIYGFLRFPDAPIRECKAAIGYCGKWGKPHTVEEFHAFLAWQRALLFVWPFAMIAGFILYRKKSKS